MKHLDLFSGIGGFALAAKWCWGDEYENVGHSEIEEFPCKVYHKHFPESRCLGDITKIKWEEGQAELITGGFPCQPHSVAGKRKASEDERDLWSECERVLCGIQPRFALFENVAGLLTSESGRFFNRVLADLARLRYDVVWQNIPACNVGAPHLRERIWILAYSDEVRRQRKENKNFWIQRFKKSDHWRTSRPSFIRVDDGISRELDSDRLSSLGNAIVPQVAYEIFKRIKEVDETT